MMASGPVVFSVWAYVIANTVKSRIEINPKLLAAIIGCSTEEITKAINFLCSEDESSRSKEANGKRMIREGEYQYLVVNHEKYINIRDEEGRREYNRQKKAEQRKRCQMMSNEMSAKEDTDTEAYIKPKNTLHQKADEDARFDEFWSQYPRKVGKAEARKAFKSVVTSEYTFQALMAGLANWAPSREWKEDQRFIPHAATFIRKERFMDMPISKPVQKVNGNWRSSNVTIEAKGRELGLIARGGESWTSFADRIQIRLDEKISS